MAKYKFTEEQMEMLRLNPYTFSVTPDMIRFTKEFKEEFWKKYQEGYSTRKILKDLGYDSEMIGKSRMISIYQQVKTEAASPQGFRDPDTNHFKAINPNNGQYQAVPDNLAMQRMQKDMIHMRQELDFLKKLLNSASQQDKQ